MPISYKHKIYTTLGTPTNLSGNVVSATDSAGVPVKDYTVKGKTIVWNQLLDKSKYPATTTTNGVTFTNNGDGSITVDGTASSTANGSITIAENLSVIQGHKYYATMSKPIEHNNFWLGLWASPAPQPFQRALVILDQNGQILTCVTSSDKLHVDITLYKTTSVSNATVKPQLFDLTQMFGAGNEPATPEEFRAMFPDDYYPYNAGELKSIMPTNIEASGIERFQLLDKNKYPATGVFDGVTYTNNGDGTITLNGTATAITNYNLQSGISVIANHKYFCVYSNIFRGSGAYPLLYTSDPAVFNTGFPMLSGDIITALKDYDKVFFQIKVSNGKTMTNMLVKPQLFDLTQMFGAGNEPATPEEFWQRVPETLYGYNPSAYKSVNIPSSKYFPDGMRSAGSAYDEINFLSQKAIKRIGAVDMGTLNWSYNPEATHERFATAVSGIKLVSPTSAKGNLTCPKYTTASADNVYMHVADKTVAVLNTAKQVWVYDTAYTDAAAFKAAMSGVMLYYELATPVETPITPPLQALQTFKGFTSFSAPNSLMQNGPLSVTYYAEGGTNPEKGWLTSYKRKLYMGRTIEWNQLLGRTNRARVTHNGVTVELQDDGSYVVNGTATDTAVIQLETSTFSTVTGHKYFVTGCPKNGSMQTFRMYDAWSGQYIDFGDGVIFVASVGKVTSNSIAVTSGYTCTNLVFKPQLFDLTQMFGTGNEPATPEEFWSYFDHKLYPYNPGETQPLFKISRKSQWGSI